MDDTKSTFNGMRIHLSRDVRLNHMIVKKLEQTHTCKDGFLKIHFNHSPVMDSNNKRGFEKIKDSTKRQAKASALMNLFSVTLTTSTRFI